MQEKSQIFVFEVRKGSDLTRIDLFWPQEDTTMKLLSVSWISGVTVIKKDLFTN